jgi:hypothetical protein
MALLTEEDVRAAARSRSARVAKSAKTVLAEATDTDEDSFDIFLSHAIADAEIVLGALSILERLGYSVYVDWIVDKELDRGRVTAESAAKLKRRMRQCATLIYLATENSPNSRWMPWELGFFDGYSGGRFAILPITGDEDDSEETYHGQEYLGIYPYVDVATIKHTDREALWVNRSRRQYGRFEKWASDGEKAIVKRKQVSLF